MPVFQMLPSKSSTIISPDAANVISCVFCEVIQYQAHEGPKESSTSGCPSQFYHETTQGN